MTDKVSLIRKLYQLETSELFTDEEIAGWLQFGIMHACLMIEYKLGLR